MDKEESDDVNVKRGKGYGNYYCPTCATPWEEQEYPIPEGFETYYCLNCNTVLGFGYLLGLNVTCPKCNAYVRIG